MSFGSGFSGTMIPSQTIEGNDFIGGVFKNIGEGIQDASKQVGDFIPRWAKMELENQVKDDRLKQPTFNDPSAETISRSSVFGSVANPVGNENTTFSLGGKSFSVNTILLVGLVIGSFVLLKSTR